ncbi:hypothetical protein JCM1393_29810 [Clostridium carnis]
MIIKIKEVKKYKRESKEVIRVDLNKNIYDKFVMKCNDIGMSKEWLD